jgi:hypothetical protein
LASTPFRRFAGLLLMPLDEIAYVIFASAHGSGLLSAQAHTVA